MPDGASRREFIKTGAAGLAVLPAGCNHANAEMRVRGVCAHDCPDACAWIVTTRDGKPVEVEGDPDHPLTRGVLCEKKSTVLQDLVFHPDRVLYPLRRTGAKGDGKFERVGWEDALADVAARLQKIIDKDGPTAILPYSYAGTEGVVQGRSLDRRFFARIGASRLQRDVCGSAGYEGLMATNGSFAGILPEDIIHSKFILIWGANPVLSNPHVWPLMEDARRRGARIVVIDPIRSATAERADLHLQPLPATDAALALGMMNVIIEGKLFDRDYVAKHTLGFDKLRARAREYPPERVAGITGLERQDIVHLAESYAKARPSTIRTLVGMEHHANGAMMFRTIACLPALTGAWKYQGGGMLHMAAHLFPLNEAAVSMPELEAKTARSINMVQLGRALTDPKLKPAVRALVVYNSNPATIAPNQGLVFQGLRREDLFTVVLDHVITDTARFADYVFPAATQVEVLDLLTSWGHQYLSINLPAAAPAGESVPNTEFFRRLARKMGFTEPYLFESDEDIVRAALKTDHPLLKGLTYERLAKEGWVSVRVPSPYLPYAEGKFGTPSGKCEFYSESLRAKGLDPLPAHVAVHTDSRFPLHLVSSKSTRNFLNSSMGHAESHMKAEGEPTVRMHSRDATPRGIRDGDLVRVFNQRGEMRLRAEVKDGVRPRVVSIPQGWWASRLKGKASVNVLTPDGLSDLGGGGDFHDAKVDVEKV